MTRAVLGIRPDSFSGKAMISTTSGQRTAAALITGDDYISRTA
jgi:hypothetical protein